MRYFEAGGTADFPAEAFLHPKFVLDEPESMPYGGEWHGPDGFRKFLKVMTETWSAMGPKTAPELIEFEDTVVVVTTLEARSRATGQVVNPPVCQVVRVREGLLTEVRMFYWDTVAINQALGRRAPLPTLERLPGPRGRDLPARGRRRHPRPDGRRQPARTPRPASRYTEVRAPGCTMGVAAMPL
ncbi:nuclear transport factor 2 family protein [Streptomyces albicerus]|uniref:nuclear transport factor 2 family protein n=1 Tax=Streptomyces albicerus TaxID=2569859 RepID=UPI0038504424